MDGDPEIGDGNRDGAAASCEGAVPIISGDDCMRSQGEVGGNEDCLRAAGSIWVERSGPQNVAAIQKGYSSTRSSILRRAGSHNCCEGYARILEYWVGGCGKQQAGA